MKGECHTIWLKLNRLKIILRLRSKMKRYQWNRKTRLPILFRKMFYIVCS